MRRLLIAAIIAASAGSAMAGTVCSTIQNPDDRAYCRAVQTGSRGQCAAIGSYDLRKTCGVRLGAPKTTCSTVTYGADRFRCTEARK